jgi:hypothetical protein
MRTVRTVLGDLPVADLGPTDYHELRGGDVARRGDSSRTVAFQGWATSGRG